MKLREFALVSIRFYQYAISPLMASHCRFYPSCSCYTHQAIEQYGLLKGGWLSLKRISRCNPWNAGGYDPIPAKRAKHPSPTAD